MTDPEKQKDGEIGFISYEYKGVPIFPVPAWYIKMLEAQMKKESQPGDIVKQLDALANEINSQPKEDYCGIVPLTTGKWDPYYKAFVCQAHDEHFTKLDKGEYATFAEFAGSIGRGMAEGAWMLLTGVPYLLIGGVLGIFRQQQLANRLNPKPPEDNLGDDA